jgi:hypothetical protein
MLRGDLHKGVRRKDGIQGGCCRMHRGVQGIMVYKVIQGKSAYKNVVVNKWIMYIHNGDRRTGIMVYNEKDI